MSKKNSRMERREKAASRTPLERAGNILFKMFIALLIVAVLGLGAGGYTSYAFIKDAPELDPEQLSMSQSSSIYDMNDNEIIDLSGKEHRELAKIENIPKLVQNSFIAVEDVRFREHNGIDLKRIAGAVVANFKNGYGSEGASTITQQVVKNTFLSTEKTLKRKVQEAYLAIKFEEKYSKDEILEMYLNKIYLGNGAYGVAAAADVYFDKTLDELTLPEAALLAGLPQRPSGYNPFLHPEKAEERRNVVLSLMNKHGFINEEEYKQAVSVSVKETLSTKKDEPKYGAFIDQVIRELKAEGYTTSELFNGGLKIYTTLDPKAQTTVEKVLTSGEKIKFPDEKLKAGLVLLDTKTGEIRAIGGNRDKAEDRTKRGFNYATQLKRQPGSTIKPILDYGPGIENEKWSTFKQFKDEELKVKDHTFKNWDDEYHGEISMRTALQWSYNIPAILAFQEVGADKAKEFAGNLGINLENAYPSHAIGGFGKGISPMQLAGAYAAFGNEGTYNKPRTVRKVVTPDGKEQSFKTEPKKAMSKAAAYMITDMLKTVIQEGTGATANIPGLAVAGKTGTTSLPPDLQDANLDGSSDAWFAGYTTDYTAAVWTGYDQTTKETYLTNDKDDYSKELFKVVMSEISKDQKPADFNKPASVVEVTLDKKTGELASGHTPSDRKTVELFIKGTEPTEHFSPAASKNDEDDKEKKQEEADKKEQEQKKKEEEKKKKKEEKKKAEEEKKKKEEEKKKEEQENTNDGQSTDGEQQDEQSTEGQTEDGTGDSSSGSSGDGSTDQSDDSSSGSSGDGSSNQTDDGSSAAADEGSGTVASSSTENKKKDGKKSADSSPSKQNTQKEEKKETKKKDHGKKKSVEKVKEKKKKDKQEKKDKKGKNNKKGAKEEG